MERLEIYFIRPFVPDIWRRQMHKDAASAYFIVHKEQRDFSRCTFSICLLIHALKLQLPVLLLH